MFAFSMIGMFSCCALMTLTTEAIMHEKIYRPAVPCANIHNSHPSQHRFVFAN